MPTVHLLDYVAGNVRSLVNAIEKVGYTVDWVKSPADVPSAEVPAPPTLSTYAPIDTR
jgi:glutamine amidotransferase/cyclase